MSVEELDERIAKCKKVIPIISRNLLAHWFLCTFIGEWIFDYIIDDIIWQKGKHSKLNYIRGGCLWEYNGNNYEAVNQHKIEVIERIIKKLEKEKLELKK